MPHSAFYKAKKGWRLALIIGIGTDIFKISRISKKSVSANDPFLMRAYTERERAEALLRHDAISYYGDRFAAKESVFKAISSCGADFKPGEIEIICDELERPLVFLAGKTKELFENMYGQNYRISISISYDTDYAVAFAIAEKQ